MAEADEERPEAARMPLLDHLEELRSRLVRSAIALLIAAGACWAFIDPIFTTFSEPLQRTLPDGSKFIFTEITEAFFIYLKLALISGTFIASPYIFYQLWMFVAPGLYAHEKKYVVPFVFFSTLLFTGGAIFGYFVIFPLAFEFLLHFAGAEVTAMPTMNSFFGFATRLLIAFGVVFEMPLAVFFLARVGVVTAEQMRGVRRYAIIAAFIVGAILTPGPDPFSQCLMALPLILLYEISIWVAKVFGRKSYQTMEEEESEALAG